MFDNHGTFHTLSNERIYPLASCTTSKEACRGLIVILFVDILSLDRIYTCKYNLEKSFFVLRYLSHLINELLSSFVFFFMSLHSLYSNEIYFQDRGER